MENIDNLNLDCNMEKIIHPKVILSPYLMYWLIQSYSPKDRSFFKINGNTMFSLQARDFKRVFHKKLDHVPIDLSILFQESDQYIAND